MTTPEGHEEKKEEGGKVRPVNESPTAPTEKQTLTTRNGLLEALGLADCATEEGYYARVKANLEQNRKNEKGY